jgi:hypothetical protein
MDVLDIFFKRYSYKFPKGYIDVEDKKDVLILEGIFKNLGLDIDLSKKELKETIKETMFKEQTDEEEEPSQTSFSKKDIIAILEKENLTQDQLKSIFSMVSGVKYRQPIMDYITSKGKGPSKEALGIYNKLIETGEVTDFAEYIKKPKKYKDIPKNGNFHAIFKPFSTELIDYLLSLEPSIGRVSTGKGEILLSIMLDDVKDAVGGGDINAAGKPVEVKNKGALPMGQGFQFGPNTIESVYKDIEKDIDLNLNEENEDYIDLNEMSVKDIAGKIRPFGKFAKVYEYIKSNAPEKVDDFNKSLKDSLQKRYVGINLNDLNLEDFEKGNSLDWEALEIFVGKKIVEKYIEDENFEEIMFLNDLKKEYSRFPSGEISDKIGKDIRLWFPDGAPRWSFKF